MSKAFLICALASALTALCGPPQFAIAADMPPDAIRLHGALMQKVQPPVRSWIGQEGKRLVMAGPKTAPDQAAVRAQVHSRFAGQRLGEMDIDALVTMVMMEAAAAAEQEMKYIAARIKKGNAEKEKIHAMMAEARERKPRAAKELQAKYDSLNEMSQTESIRLQMLMDRRAKLMEMISNLMKKISDTQSTLVGNLK
jgi:hypothetical protein